MVFEILLRERRERNPRPNAVGAFENDTIAGLNIAADKHNVVGALQD
jgi:hypothetical protein